MSELLNIRPDGVVACAEIRAVTMADSDINLGRNNVGLFFITIKLDIHLKKVSNREFTR